MMETTVIEQAERPWLEQPRHQHLVVFSRDGVLSELEACVSAHEWNFCRKETDLQCAYALTSDGALRQAIECVSAQRCLH